MRLRSSELEQGYRCNGEETSLHFDGNVWQAAGFCKANDSRFKERLLPTSGSMSECLDETKRERAQLFTVQFKGHNKGYI